MRRPAVLLVVAVAALAGCSEAQETEPSPSSAITGTPLALSCDELVPPSALTGLWSEFSPSEVEPTPVSTEIAGYDGLVCGWSDGSGATLQLAVAQLDPDIIEALKNEFYTTSNAVPTYGKPPAVEGYYEVASGRGVADVLAEQYWLEASSESFVEPGDPEPLVRAALSALTG
ncbi:hypothetical protein SAMN06295885_1005 [Rathayibacter oskolensis]|uniref:Uncharacterized protein n=1 Tax=Rathayibacter oskolensis TaxID=1891671 RepID=A0A1X7NA86_9MICO|nr:hypothetical protein [Rathayibacter oskolensis]SMH34494.1 hypothetical protein SAMN06295885_1005 [Rathayibacter oskolensis]